MALRTILIRVLLGSLGATALCAVLAIFAGGAQWGWQLTGTAAILAVASALLTPLSRVGDLRAVPPVAVAWALVIVLDTGVAIVGVWDAFPNRLEEEIALTAVLLVAWLVLALPGLGLAGGRSQRAAGVVMAGGATGAFIWWDAIVWGATLDNGERGFLFAGTGFLLGTVLLQFRERSEQSSERVARLLGVGLTVLASVWLLAILPTRNLISPPEPSLLAVGIGLSTLAVVVVAHRASHMLAGPAWRVVLHLAALVAIGTFGTLLAWAAWNSFPSHGWLLNAVASMGVLSGTGFLASLLLHLFSRGVTNKRKPLAEVTSLRVECPSCGLRQPIVPGCGSCGRCGLGFEVRVTLLACPNCSYELAGLPAGAACPECGDSLGVRELPAGGCAG